MMILEAIVTTLNEDNRVNISPMGPLVTGDDLSRFELRPFNTSTTFANLERSGCGVLHITDDVELFARSAIGQLETEPRLVDAETIAGKILADACRGCEFQVEFIEGPGPRMHLNCRTTRLFRFRDFFGFNRAKHAVIEAAILATRVDFLPAELIASQFRDLASAVTKTGGESERRAFDLLSHYVNLVIAPQ